MDFWLLDEIMKTGWIYSISGLPGRKVLVILVVPDFNPHSATVDNFREALKWLEETIVERHAETPLGKRLGPSEFDKALKRESARSIRNGAA